MKKGVMMHIGLSISAFQRNRMPQHLSSLNLLPNLSSLAPKRGAIWLCALLTGCVLSACGGGTSPVNTSPVNTSTDNTGTNNTGTNTGGNTKTGSTTFTIGGTLTGLADGQTLALSLGTQTLHPQRHGAFTFATPVTSGASYEVKVSGLQPAWQTCSVTGGTGTASANVSSVAVSCVSADTAPTGKLNDTGIDACTDGNGTSTLSACTAGSGQQQDASFGHDAQAQAGRLTKVGSGMAGFDFTRIGASGKLLAKQDATWSDTGTEAASTQWDCVRDNTTGLVWEVKRYDSAHLRYVYRLFSWYNPDYSTNGGAPGSLGNNTCVAMASDTLPCNTHSYVAAVNAVGLCGKKDWRVPTVDELRNLTHTGRTNPTSDSNHFPDTLSGSDEGFPNTKGGRYWTSSPSAGKSSNAWYVSFSHGHDNGGFDGTFVNKGNSYRVRLVRSGN